MTNSTLNPVSALPQFMAAQMNPNPMEQIHQNNLPTAIQHETPNRQINNHPNNNIPNLNANHMQQVQQEQPHHRQPQQQPDQQVQILPPTQQQPPRRAETIPNQERNPISPNPFPPIVVVPPGHRVNDYTTISSTSSVTTKEKLQGIHQGVSLWLPCIYSSTSATV
jgi:hypothetical protein